MNRAGSSTFVNQRIPAIASYGAGVIDPYECRKDTSSPIAGWHPVFVDAATSRPAPSTSTTANRGTVTVIAIAPTGAGGVGSRETRGGHSGAATQTGAGESEYVSPNAHTTVGAKSGDTTWAAVVDDSAWAEDADVACPTARTASTPTVIWNAMTGRMAATVLTRPHQCPKPDRPLMTPPRVGDVFQTTAPLGRCGAAHPRLTDPLGSLKLVTIRTIGDRTVTAARQDSTEPTWLRAVRSKVQ